jgi:hypothetical protein
MAFRTARAPRALLPSGRLQETRKQRLLKSAAELIGHDELAVRMKIPGSLLEAWISGHATMPDRKLVALAELLDKLADQVRQRPSSPRAHDR